MGMVHRRLGIDSVRFLSTMHLLKSLINARVEQLLPQRELCLAQIKSARQHAERFETDLEQQVRERTGELEELARTDPLTGLQSVRYLRETLPACLSAATQ